MTPSWPTFAAVGLTLAAFGLRAFHLTATGLWADEYLTVWLAGQPLVPLVNRMALSEPNPPFYYLLVKVLLRALGDNDLILRFPSAAASTMIVPATFGLARKIAGPLAGLIAAGLVVLSPFLVWYGQETRVYAILALASAIVALRLWIALTTGTVRAWAFYALALAFTIETHYFAMALVGLHGVLILIWPIPWHEKRRGILALAAGIATFVPWLIYARHLYTPGWMQPITVGEAVRRTLWALGVGTSVAPEQGWLLSAPLILAAVLGAYRLATARNPLDRAAGWLLVGSTLAPFVLVYGIGVATGRATYLERYVIGATPPALVLAAVGVAGLLRTPWRASWPPVARGWTFGGAPTRRARFIRGATAVVGAVLLLATIRGEAVSLWQHYFDAHFAKEDLRGAATFVDALAAPDDPLIGSPSRITLFDRYTRLSLPTLISLEDWDEARLDRQVANAGNARQVWLLPDTDVSDAVLKGWLDAHAYALDGLWFGQAPLQSWLEDADPAMQAAGMSFDSVEDPVLSVSRAGLGIAMRVDERIVKLAFEWQPRRQLDRLTLSMRLVDAKDRTVAHVDRPLAWLKDSGELADGTQMERSALRVPADAPGGRYSVRVAMYDPAGSLNARSGSGTSSEWTVGEIALPKSTSGDATLVDATRIDNLAVGTDLRLIGHEPVSPVPAGARTTIVLHWQAVTPGAFAPGVLGMTRLSLRDSPGGVAPEPATIDGAPTRAGGLLRDARELRVARDTAPGKHDVVLQGTSPNSPPVVVDTIEVTPAEAPPALATPSHPMNARLGPISLVGYDLAGKPSAGGRLVVRLYWKAVSDGNEDLSVFVHVARADEQILAQHDGRPCAGTCPTADWTAGDTFVDEHAIDLPSNAPPGSYRLLVGLYDPRTGKRLARVDPAPAILADRILLGEITIPD